MKITPRLDVLGLVDKTYKAQKNLAYSVVQGINATAKMVQEAQRQELGQHFTLRTAKTKTFMERQAAVIKPFASVKQGRLFAEVAVGQRPKLLLAGFETGAKRQPMKGSVIAQPVVGGPARPNFNEPVATAFTFRSLALKAVRDKNGKKQYKGRHDTFTIAGRGVFQRLGPGRDAVQLVYRYDKEQQLPAKLNWMKTARDIAERWLDENITRAFLKSAKKP